MARSRLTSFLNWSVRIGDLFGIPINLHISLIFFLLPVLSSRGGLGFWHSLEYAVAVVLCILLHELGHAFAAKRYRLSGLSIMLHGFGGFAVSHGYRSPKQQLVISLAGPAVTFGIGALGLLISRAGGQAASLSAEAAMQFFLVGYLGSLNILLGFLNLIPSLPFDGGHALQALLAMKMPEFKAMRAVGHLGLLLSPLIALQGYGKGEDFVVVFGLIGLFSSYATLMKSGGIRFGEFLADRRTRKEIERIKLKEEERHRAYLDDVRGRQKEREERDRLRKLLEVSLEE